MQLAFLVAVFSLLVAQQGAPARISAPVSADLVGLMEVRLRVDEPFDKDRLAAFAQDVVGRSIAYHEIDWAANGAAARGKPLGRLRIAAARVVHGEIIARTDPHPRRALYVLDWIDTPQKKHPQYLCSGVEESWYTGGEEDPTTYTTTRDSLDVRPRSSGREIIRVGQPKRVMFRSTILAPKGSQTLLLRSNVAFEASWGNQEIEPNAEGKTHRAEFVVNSTGEPVELTITLKTDSAGPSWEFSAFWKQENGDLPIPPSQLALPWLPIMPDATKPPPAPYRLDGGDPKKGAEVFASEAAKCSSCHTIAGKGGNVGPNLDLVSKKEIGEIYQSIAEPSSVIVPEYLTYTVARKDGQIAVGVVRADGFDSISVSDINGKATIIPRSEIDELRPSMTSTMPVGLAGALGEEKMRDLIAFIKSAPSK